MKISREEILGLFDEEPEPETERRPDLAKAWAERMNDVVETRLNQSEQRRTAPEK
jgi:hypothetical protein